MYNSFFLVELLSLFPAILSALFANLTSSASAPCDAGKRSCQIISQRSISGGWAPNTAALPWKLVAKRLTCFLAPGTY